MLKSRHLPGLPALPYFIKGVITSLVVRNIHLFSHHIYFINSDICLKSCVYLFQASFCACGGFLVREDFVMTAIQTGLHQTQFPACPAGITICFSISFSINQLEQNVTLNENIKPIPLPKIITDLPEGTNCLASGWGIISEEGTQIPDTLQEANIQVVERSCCRKQWGKIINKKMLCTEEVGCVGDSGGPLVCDGMAYGITSFGIEPCGFYGFPTKTEYTDTDSKFNGK
uniref:Duodenase-1-like n=1 Tax=Erpetoichthys calabaricus TaxID=27687 RepID=A0A8C4SSD1_ERPCA